MRSRVRSPDSSRFLASCCVMVEPPRSLGGRGSLPRARACAARRAAISSALRVALARALDGFPFDALVVDELAVLAGDHGALERCRRSARTAPSAAPIRVRRLGAPAGGDQPGLGALEGGGLRIDRRHRGDAQRRRRAPAPAPRAAGTAASEQGAFTLASTMARSSASTCAEGGRTPRQMTKASAACSTSMPRPSRGVAPCSRAQSMKPAAAGPYIMSIASAPGLSTPAATGTVAARQAGGAWR